MSQDGIKALWDRIAEDDSFRDLLLAADSNEQRRRLVAEAGYEVSPSDLPALRELAGLGELSDEELELVTGGGLGTDYAVALGAGVGGGVGGVVIGIGAAVAGVLAL